MLETFSLLAHMPDALRPVLAAAVVLAGYVVFRLAWRFVLTPIAGRVSSGLNNTLVASSDRPVRVLYWGVGLFIVSRLSLAALPEEWTSCRRVMTDGPFVLLLVTALAAVFALMKGFERWYVGRAGAGPVAAGRRSFVIVGRRFLKLSFFFIAGVMLLDYYGVKITALLGAAGIASLAVAFAAQETLANIIAGVAIIADQPFRVGDRIELADGRIGDVKDIGLRSTKILSFDSTLLIVPNSEIIKSPVVNHSYPDSRVKIRHPLGVAYGTDIDKARKIIFDVLAGIDIVLNDPRPAVFFTDFGDSSLNLLVVFWIEDYNDRFLVIDRFNSGVDTAFRENGVEIPFPQRDVWIRRTA
ncbi:MAG: mechanosensitive ion channel family protein [Planctomycetes bacterium]|nr:mechanosensitive ion channel family protein [Planctomycetota bacterium]